MFESLFWPNVNPLELLSFDEGVVTFELFFWPNENPMLFGKPLLFRGFISLLRVK